MNSPEGLDQLEKQAREEREQLWATAQELRTKLAATREKLNPSTMVRDHFIAASAAAATLGLILGHSFAGLFLREQGMNLEYGDRDAHL